MKWLKALAVLMLIAPGAHAITCADIDGAYLVSQDSTPRYLGFVGSRFASESIMNQYGQFGNPYGTYSVRNTYGTYGSPYSSLSANNPYSTRPPVLAKAGVFITFLTTNTVAINGGFGLSLAAIDSTCTSLFSSSPVGPLVVPQLPTYTTPTPPVYQLTNAVTVGPFSGAQGSELQFKINVPAGASGLSVISVGSGDADIYVRYGAPPTPTNVDCRSEAANTSNETCAIASPTAGMWYITMVGYTSFQNVIMAAGYVLPTLIGVHNAGIFGNPQRSGEGAQIVYSQSGTTPLLGITWYTYDLLGNPLFLVGGAVIDRGVPGPHTIPVAISRGAKFGTAFNPADVVRTIWGNVVITFSDCDNFFLDYSSSIDGYGTGRIPMGRAAPRATGVTCPGQ